MSVRSISLSAAIAEECTFPKSCGSMAALEIFADSAALVAALSALTELAKTRGELVQAFLNAIDAPAQLIRLDLDGLLAAGAGQCRILFQPSDLLVEFLAASRAGERDGL